MRLSREGRRRLERKRAKKKKRVNTYPIISLCALLALNGNSVVNAATVDDIRELTGEQRMDEIFSGLEKRRIMLEYTKIENHNRIARMFAQTKNIDVTSEAIKEREKIISEIEKQRDMLLNSFSSGQSIDDILAVKSNLDNLEYKESRIKKVGDEIELKVIPNTFADDYNRLMKTLKEISSFKELGDIGVDMESPVRGMFELLTPFGMRLNPVNKTKEMHWGIDLVGTQGQDVLAAWNGVVSSIDTTEEDGNIIEIDHGNGLKTRYANLGAIKVKVGQKVKQYDEIGSVGSIVEDAEPHLHFEVHLNGKPINPIYLFGSNGANALKEYLSMVEDEMYADMRPLLASIKDRPRWLEKKLEEEKKTKEMEEIEAMLGEDEDEPVTYEKSGEVPKGSIKVRLAKGYKMPNPDDEIDE